MTRIALAACFLALLAPAAPALEATGLDAITTPGRPVRVSAKFEHRGWAFFRLDVRRAGANVSVLGQTTRAVTDGDGVAYATVTPTAPGVHPIDAWLDREPGTRARGRLFVFDPARPVVVVDVDGTISDLPDWRVPFDGDRAPAFAGSVQVLTELARTHHVVYLTARDDTLDAKTRAFLARHGFPDGPVVFNDQGLWTRAERLRIVPRNHGRAKRAQLEALRARGVRLALGIGNAETDGEAYEGVGLPSYLNTRERGAGSSIRFTRWDTELRPRLVADGHLPRSRGLVGSIP